MTLNKGKAHIRLEDYWTAKCRGDLWPSYKGFDLMELADILPELFFLDVLLEDETVKLRYGFTGSAGVILARREVTGLWFHDLYTDKETDVMIGVVRETVKTRKPILFQTTMWAPDREHINVNWLACPLADNGIDIDGVVMALEKQRKT